jgi:mannose-1-phosphate guanylyltransferase
MIEKAYALIMAGGIGSRFWPKSRRTLPKQYLPLIQSDSMIQTAAKRIQNFLPDNRIFVITTQDQIPLVHKHLPWLDANQIIGEPFGRNTAPCIGVSAIILSHLDPEAFMIVLPADHAIVNTQKFINIIQNCIEHVDQHPDFLMTIGIPPTYAATGYGYIQRGEAIGADGAYRVISFTEKPDMKTAQIYLQSGFYYWNSGMFVWKVKTVIHLFERFMPSLYKELCKLKNALHKKDVNKVLQSIYQRIEAKSIDFGIMEKAQNVMMVEGDFGWSDVGSWDEVFRMSSKDKNGNVIKGEPLIKDVNDSYIEINGKRSVAIIGVRDLIVVDTADALLICKREHSQDVKWVVER